MQRDPIVGKEWFTPSKTALSCVLNAITSKLTNKRPITIRKMLQHLFTLYLDIAPPYRMELWNKEKTILYAPILEW